MSTEKLVVPGFGVGSALGSPVTFGLAPTSTILLSTALPSAGWYLATGMITGVNISYLSASNGVTGTWVGLNGVPGWFWHDGSTSLELKNTTTTATIVFITPN